MASQVQRHGCELLIATTLREENLEMIRHFHNLAEVDLELPSDVLECLLSVRHLSNTYAHSLIVNEVLLGGSDH